MRVVLGWIALAIFLLGIGALLLGAVTGLLPADFFDEAANVWAVAVVLGGALGLFLVLSSGLSASPRPRPFIFDRGEARRGRLEIGAGSIDFNVSAHAPDMVEILAGGQAAGGHLPRFNADGGAAAIQFPTRPLPIFGVDLSEVTLTPNVPWAVEVRTSLGNLDMDLFHLIVPSVEVRGALGDIHLITPTAGVTAASLTTWLGDARIEVPTGVAVRINARPSKFAEIKVDEKRWPRLDDGSWVSPDYTTAPHRLTLNLKTTFGNISVS